MTNAQERILTTLIRSKSRSVIGKMHKIFDKPFVNEMNYPLNNFYIRDFVKNSFRFVETILVYHYKTRIFTNLCTRCSNKHGRVVLVPCQK